MYSRRFCLPPIAQPCRKEPAAYRFSDQTAEHEQPACDKDRAPVWMLESSSCCCLVDLGLRNRLDFSGGIGRTKRNIHELHERISTRGTRVVIDATTKLFGVSSRQYRGHHQACKNRQKRFLQLNFSSKSDVFFVCQSTQVNNPRLKAAGSLADLYERTDETGCLFGSSLHSFGITMGYGWAGPFVSDL